ncbi:hypothetical protein [Leucobacter soli]|uniref:hypothetical protein n=1 Tax=Leucobacter soli TaxID=2812850 RepID=UPI00361B9F42
MSDVLLLADHATRDDLRVYLERLSRTGLPDVRLVSRGDVLAVFGCTQAPEGLLDQVPVVLVLRSFALAADSAPGGARGIDRVVPARGLLDRLARLGLVGLTLELPDVESNAAWAGVLPPAGGWQDAGAVDAASLARVAEEGIRRTAEALPDSPARRSCAAFGPVSGEPRSHRASRLRSPSRPRRWVSSLRWTTPGMLPGKTLRPDPRRRGPRLRGPPPRRP